MYHRFRCHYDVRPRGENSDYVVDAADTFQTKGRALEELNEMFNNRVPAYRFSKYQTTKDKLLAQETVPEDRQSV